MTPRRHRTFLDHKPPLVAFVLVAVASMGLMVHVARSDAAPAWLREGATVVVSGGSPLTRQVLERTVPERDPAPVVTDAPVVLAPPAPAASGSRPSAAPVHEPARPPHHAAPPRNDGRATPDLQPAPPVPSEAPTEEPATPAYPSKSPNVPAHQAPGLPAGPDDEREGGRPDPEPIRGSGAEHGHGHPWYDEDWQDADDGPEHGHGHGHEHGQEHGHGHGSDDDRDRGHGHEDHGPRGHGHH